jgi:3-deoxy-D-manno-octulosonic-acid transferase
MQLLAPVIVLILLKRKRKGKEDASWKRFKERLGVASVARPEGKLVWFLCASVGESLSILPVIEDMKKEDPSLNFLITTTTVSSAAILQKKMPEYCIHQYVPVDVPSFVKKFMKYWAPDILFNVDSEIWPNLVLRANRTGIRMGILNARMQDKSFATWKKNMKSANRIFSSYDFAIACDDDSAEKFKYLGIRDVRSYGNIKSGYAPKSPNKEDIDEFKKLIGNRKFFTVSSTHPSVEEEKEVFRAFEKVLEKHKDALMILAPRHINLASNVEKWAEKDFGFKVAVRSKGEKLTKDVNVYLADTMGELNLWYKLADLAFIGGSMHKTLGGHNPMEPAYLDCIVCAGRNVKTFKESYDEMEAAGFFKYVDSSDQLADFILKCFDDEKFLNETKNKVSKFMREKSKIRTFVIEDVMKFI